MVTADEPKNPGQVVRVPAGIKSYCPDYATGLTTDGTESAQLVELQKFNGQFYYQTGTNGFVLKCPLCENRHNFPIKQ